ncbi:hypothetical protein M0R45_021882 [Rubus argutus]|uniref:Uncharacterized protein n=1 Tax=Rubus argutus TaxID=59490 RepID=A0AAW1XCT6_RUBAR
MISNKKAAASASAASASVVGARTARACDSCIKKRARWYCAADDAFLCQACDSSVHSANQLARRHNRVLLKTASSLKSSRTSSNNNSQVPSWHGGFTRKARTPRHGKSVTPRSRFPLVPEVGADDVSYEENDEEQLLYRVPVFDPFVAELCSTSPNSNTDINGNESKAGLLPNYYGDNGNSSSHGFHLPSDMDLAEFAADVDSLLGRGLDDDECFGIQGLGLMDCNEKESTTTEEDGSSGRVKREHDEEDAYMGCQAETEIDLMREPFVLNFEDYDDSPASCAEEEEDEDDKLGVRMGLDGMKGSNGEHNNCKKRKIFLRLDYDAVITNWNSQSKGSPWTFGDRPDFSSDFLPDWMGTSSGGELLHYPLSGVVGVHPAMTDAGREAKVSRYKEKRRTRLFSKKIRYEVRKLNAEKRPRMKGRFVKRASFAAS